MMNSQKMVYFFSANQADGKADMKNLLGGKGANLAEMCNLGIPVPAGFTITTEVCNQYYQNHRQYPEGLHGQVEDTLRQVEEAMQKQFGNPEQPLLLSVRSGARVSMPGMMDTVLNLGINDQIVEGLAKLTGNEWFAWDSYRRFVQMYGDVVLGLKPLGKDEYDPFEEIIDNTKQSKGIDLDTDLSVNDLKELVEKFKQAIQSRTGRQFPEDPYEQLWGAIGAVFGSWQNERAIKYRKLNEIPGEWGTAVNVQAMVYGNMGDSSATGVAFTRNPATGENYFYGEYLVNAQGEDVVAGVRTPQPINQAGKKGDEDMPLEALMPELYQELVEIRNRLEQHYRDMQDVEFTIERGKLWMLQTRTGKRTAKSALRIAVEMVNEGLINKEEALLRINPNQLDQLLHPTFDPKAKKELIAKGLPASPGAATGRVVFNAIDAEDWSARGEKVILVRLETSPEDIGGMHAAQGILTARGGMTSHAAVVARGMGKCCVAGCKEINVDYNSRQFRAGDQIIHEGDYISLNGSTGEVMKGQVSTIQPELSGNFGILLGWAHNVKRLKVYANADNPEDAQVARDFGAEGIGLCRTEHMFFEGERIKVVQEMIMAKTREGRKAALNKLLPMQIEDFKGIFKKMDGLPVTIRTLDPPLHEFLPNKEELTEKLMDLKIHLKDAKSIQEINETIAKIKEKELLLETVESLQEFNPMLGTRGCRLGIMYPEITEMQAQAIFQAACECRRKGIDARPEIMIPLVSGEAELAHQKQVVERIAVETLSQHCVNLEYKIGTMIELPRAALKADKIAKVAAFFSFGTNDLTQTAFGFSRDDASKFLPMYIEKGILDHDPFEQIDREGVGELVRIASEKGKGSKSELMTGVCGEHGGDPYSVEFFHSVGLDYVSCSPYRVPIARLAAAQALLKEREAEQAILA